MDNTDYEVKYKQLEDRWDKLHSQSRWGLLASIFVGGLAIGLSIGVSHWFLLLFIPYQVVVFFCLWCFRGIVCTRHKMSELTTRHYGRKD
jgi:hypothetical protein